MRKPGDIIHFGTCSALILRKEYNMANKEQGKNRDKDKKKKKKDKEKKKVKESVK